MQQIAAFFRISAIQEMPDQLARTGQYVCSKLVDASRTEMCLHGPKQFDTRALKIGRSCGGSQSQPACEIRPFNFSAGPANFTARVLQQAAAEMPGLARQRYERHGNESSRKEFISIYKRLKRTGN
jgi:hypothetical protein